MRTQWVKDDIIKNILSALTVENRLACIVSLETGLRIGDVLALKTSQLLKSDGRFTVKEMKTGKSKRVRLSHNLLSECLKISGRYFVFEHRTNPKLHRTRQAVFKDLKRSAKAFRVSKNIAPHSMRKVYAVNAFKKYGSVKKVSELLNHSDEAVTYIYAMADRIMK